MRDASFSRVREKVARGSGSDEGSATFGEVFPSPVCCTGLLSREATGFTQLLYGCLLYPREFD
ncbi:hypothetical protein ASF08_08425 [Methylobacterium sp. Leaf85]|jgi:hypothetical protein|uniref:Uncharacterized protein n=1 Tax=Methylobacterium bullatum TaxID=570505 RepID=A0AAV4Z2R5_9HYPH|nr:hypothetical protein ASF08_08425 [Methylobacterium sp. Leaf85]MBD8901686.1 hypothetical protein [Methylobacterium bullatum]GJD38360.1 hypothetical protein OICFNHDK_0805 [Methylobacterium bullatum]